MGDAPGKQPTPSLPHVLSNIVSGSGEIPSVAKEPQETSTEQYGYYGQEQPSIQAIFQAQLAPQQQYHSHHLRQTHHGVQQPPVEQLPPQNRQQFMNMSSMTNVLPEVGYPQNYNQHQQQPSMQRFSPVAPNPAFMYQFPGQPQTTNAAFHVHYPQHYQPIFTTPQQAMQEGPDSGNLHGRHQYTSAGFLSPQAQQMTPYFYQQSQYSPQSQQFSQPFLPQSSGRSNVSSDGTSIGRSKSREQFRSSSSSGQMNISSGETPGSLSMSLFRIQ